MSIHVFKRPFLPQSRVLKFYKMFFLAFLILCVYSCKNESDDTPQLAPDLQELIDQRENEKQIIEKLIDNNIKITLIVDAENLFKTTQNDKDTVNAYTTLDATGKTKIGKGCPKKDFTVPVNRASKISWFIDESSSTSSYSVKFISIEYVEIRGSYNFFNTTTLTPQSGNERKISADIEDGWEGQQYEYVINFEINNTENGDVKEFQVDPKLKMYAEDKLLEFYDR